MYMTEMIDVNKKWTWYEKLIFRYVTIWFVLWIIPFPWHQSFYRAIAQADWPLPHFKELLNIVRAEPQFYFREGSLWNWLVAAFIAMVGTIVWGLLDKKRLHYTKEYYGLRVLLRYKLALSIVFFGFYKVFQLQMPFPSISNLHTNYGDFFPWKIYYQTLGITPEYESLLGLAEIVAGLLLFYRPTVTFGAGIIAGFLANVVAVSWFYNTGDLSYSAVLLIMAILLFLHDVPRLYALLVLQRNVLADRIEKPFFKNSFPRIWLSGKLIFLVLFFLAAYTAYDTNRNDPFKIPRGQVLPVKAGFYNVRVFAYNKDTIPYSLTDTLRWQNVIFEHWPTISIKNNQSVAADFSFGDTLTQNNIDRNYEVAGFGGRQYYSYLPDTLKKTLTLLNKSRHRRAEKYEFKYEKINDSTLVLQGVNEQRDSIYIVLDRMNKRYLMLEGLRKPVTL